MSEIDIWVCFLQEIPPPGSYDVAKSHTKSQVKKDLAPPRTSAAKARQGAFKSSASRFAPPRDVVISEADPLNPGKTQTHSRAGGIYEHKISCGFSIWHHKCI